MKNVSLTDPAASRAGIYIFLSSMQAIFRRETIPFVHKSRLMPGEDAGERNMLF